MPEDPTRENRRIALKLRDYADLLEAQGEDGFRVRAYRRAADEAETLDVPLREVFEHGGLAALIALPGIGRGIAAGIAEMLQTGRWSQLDRLRQGAMPETLFRSLPGVGEVLAAKFAEALGAHSLEDLETALHDPGVRLDGLGPRRRAAILAALSERLQAMRRGRDRQAPGAEPPVSLLLDADALYREKAAAGQLRRIRPRRFNPRGEAWLPVMHLRRGDWHLTALFSNTARAHELGRTRDWVALFFHEGDGPEMQRTVVTETRGPLAGKRVVRGREADCATHYGERAAAAT
ncbi:DNA-binding protein (plasmid) [Salipiger sp. H15]|uniref:DNA-binding protein n=1 Tax=Alloyangia sp. H15 TaxID=3029062 RepID=A0AAU8AS84_9RHOB